MGGDKARQQAQQQQPVQPEEKKVKKSRGGFYGVGEVTPTDLLTGSSRRGAFLGGG